MNEVTIMPNEMKKRKFYCHRCGNQLIPHPQTRTIKRGDPDYKRYRSVGRLHLIGDITLTEYGFRCTSCDALTSYDTQCVVEELQKSMGTLLLSQETVDEREEKVKAEFVRATKKDAVIGKVVQAVTILLLIGCWLISEHC